MAKFKAGDIVWVHGITDLRTNLPCRGIVHHAFVGHYPTDINYVIAVDILYGDFVVRDDGTTWKTENTYKER